MLQNNRQILAALLLAVFASYSNALLWGAFQFDDYNIIVDNPVVHSWSAWWADVGHGIRPLLKLSYTLDWTLGWGEAGFHLTNVLIHSGNTVLVWLLTASFLGCSNRLASSALLVSVMSALLFAVHPIHTEAITYISGRSSSLMALFYLGGMLCYMTGRQKQNWLYLHVATPLLFVAALAVKEIAITFPLALMLLHVASGGRWRTLMSLTWTSWLVFIAGAIYFLSDAGYQQHLVRSLDAHEGLSTLAVQANALLYLLRQWFFPLWLNIDPDLSGAHVLSVFKMALMVCGLIAALFVGAKLRQHPWLAFALAWVLLHLFLVYLIAPRIDIANERQLYLASWPLSMAVMAELVILLTARQFIRVSLILLIAAGTLTLLRNLDYRDEITLWQATVQLSPDKSRVHNNLGYAFDLDGQHEVARQHYLKALALDRQNFRARYNMEQRGAGER